MADNNVYSSATIVKANNQEKMQSYELGTFTGTTINNQNQEMQNVAKLNETNVNGNIDPVLAELKNLQAQIATLTSKVSNIENDGVSGRDIDKQVVSAIKDLKHYASFFEQATFQMETKILKTSMSIAQKIIGLEVSSNSANIAKE
ncbi:MAG: flagellar assembly protein FliH, partial [Campylobacteraceae bacterium]|nr:flagellar assembly protein FliH [Campylobacteraceae bacterium]